MNPAQLLEYFDRISEAPDAVARLRRFILDLAVRGKLVEQDPSDEPAAELLLQMLAEKMRLENAGEIRKEKLLPPISTMPYEIPTGWVWTRLGGTGRIFNGNSVSESAKADLSTVKEGYPFIATKDVGYGRDRLAYENGIRVPFEADGFRVAHSQAVLICAEGGSAGKKIGLADRDICFGNKLYANETWTGIHPKFILSLYQSTSFYTEFTSRMTGIIGGIARSEFLLIPVPLPPEAEQHRIVAKVDELMALCDQLEAAKSEREGRRDRLVAASLHCISTAPTVEDEAAMQASGSAPLRDAARFHLDHLSRLTTRPEHIKQLRQAVLNLAVRGRLVPQDPNDEPASEVLKCVVGERAALIKAGRIRKGKPLTPIANESVPFEIPRSWVWAKIGEAALFTEYGTSQQSNHSDSGVPVLKMGDIQDGRLLLGGQKKVPATIDDLPALYLENRDLLYNRTNSAELVGKTGIYIGSDNEYTFASYLIRIRCSRLSTSPEYFNMAMNAPWFRETQIVPQLKQQCGQANVNGTMMKNMLIPLPPLAEQHRIVAKVDELMALCEQLEAQLTTTQTDSRRLLEAVLHEALATAA